jgi:peptidoglycan/LPS O-acetylase OafA/YrhL
MELSSNVNQLQRVPATFREPISIVKGVLNFLFSPSPFVDNGSFFLNLQSYESFAWYIYYALLLLLIFGLLRRKYQINLLSVASSLFTLGFILLSAFVEINDGTAVRHRSVLLLGIIIMLATFRVKSTKNKDSYFIK